MAIAKEGSVVYVEAPKADESRFRVEVDICYVPLTS